MEKVTYFKMFPLLFNESKKILILNNWGKGINFFVHFPIPLFIFGIDHSLANVQTHNIVMYVVYFAGREGTLG